MSKLKEYVGKLYTCAKSVIEWMEENEDEIKNAVLFTVFIASVVGFFVIAVVIVISESTPTAKKPKPPVVAEAKPTEKKPSEAEQKKQAAQVVIGSQVKSRDVFGKATFPVYNENDKEFLDSTMQQFGYLSEQLMSAMKSSNDALCAFERFTCQLIDQEDKETEKKFMFLRAFYETEKRKSKDAHDNIKKFIEETGLDKTEEGRKCIESWSKKVIELDNKLMKEHHNNLKECDRIRSSLFEGYIQSTKGV